MSDLTPREDALLAAVMEFSSAISAAMEKIAADLVEIFPESFDDDDE